MDPIFFTIEFYASNYIQLHTSIASTTIVYGRKKNTYEGIRVASLSDLTEIWKVTMSPMIQKFLVFRKICLTKKKGSKNTYPFGRSSDDRQTDKQTWHKNDPYWGIYI